MSAPAWAWLGRLTLAADGREAANRVRHARAVLLVVAYYADGSGVASPAADWIAAYTGLSRRTVRRVLVDLRAAGVLDLIAPPAPGRASTHRLNLSVESARLPARPAPTTGDTQDGHRSDPQRRPSRMATDPGTTGDTQAGPRSGDTQDGHRSDPRTAATQGGHRSGSNGGQTEPTVATQGGPPQEDTSKKEEEPRVADDLLSAASGDPRDNAADEDEPVASSEEEALRPEAASPPVEGGVAVLAEDWERKLSRIAAESRRGSSKKKPSKPASRPEGSVADRLAAELAGHPDGASAATLAVALGVGDGTVRKTLNRFPERFVRVDATEPSDPVLWKLVEEGDR